jgi:hypothetical protein
MAETTEQQQPPQMAAPTQQGSRWLHAMPSEQMVKEWFDTQHLHMGMHHEPYYGGIVIIPAVEKFKFTVIGANGRTFINEAERQVYTPYVKVDTRVAYFWQLVEVMNLAHENGENMSAGTDGWVEDKFVGVIEPVPQRVIKNPASPYYNEHLPEGFFIWAAKGSNNNQSNYICAQWSVAIYERQSYAAKIAGQRALPILKGIGTKQTLQAKAYPDDNALMKAETGAIGRALGVAGILVVGTGIATAEDMQEALANAAAPIVNREGAELPGIVGPSVDEQSAGTRIEGPSVQPQGVGAPTIDTEQAPSTPQAEDDENRIKAQDLAAKLKAFPEAWEKYIHWYQVERKFPTLTELSGTALKGALVKLERALDEAQNPKEPDASANPGQ